MGQFVTHPDYSSFWRARLRVYFGPNRVGRQGPGPEKKECQVSTQNTIRERKSEAMQAQDWDEWRRLENEEAAARLQAIHKGIDDAESHTYYTRKLTQLERAAAVTAAERLASVLEEHVPEEIVLVIAEHYANYIMADTPLRAKLEVAYNLEYDVCEKGVEDGILGRALDRAIEEMLPYAKRRSGGPGWYGSAMADESPHGSA